MSGLSPLPHFLPSSLSSVEAMAPLLRFETAGRGFARDVVERHSPQAGFYFDKLAESDAVYSASNPVSLVGKRDIPNTSSGFPVVSIPSLTVSTKALVGIIVFFSVVVLGVVGCRLKKFLRSRRPKAAKSPYLKPLGLCQSPLPEKIVSEKRDPMNTQSLIDFGYDSPLPPSKVWSQPKKSHMVYSESEAQYAGWVPQIRSRPEDTKAVSSPDAIPRPFLAHPPPALTTTRQSRFSRLLAAFTRSSKPSESSFDIETALPYISAATIPGSRSPAIAPSPLAASALSRQSSDDSQERNPVDGKLQKPPHNLPPILAHAPSIKTSRVAVAAFEPSPIEETVNAETTQAVLVNAKDGVSVDASAVKSPTRLDSAILAGKFVPEKKDAMLQTSCSSTEAHRKSGTSPHAISTSKTTGSEMEGKDLAARRKVPRLVTVVDTFPPKLKDELLVRVGEVLRLTHEFRDGWCAVERLEKDGVRGVVPSFCIGDRASITTGRRDSIGGATLPLPGQY